MISSKKIDVDRRITVFCRIFQQAGFEIYLVGGVVRDFFLNRTVFDYDFASNAYPQQVQKLFKNVIPTGIRHGTVTVIFKGLHLEVTTYRTDGIYSDRRHPDTVTYAETLDEDLARRDFTINALAYNPCNDRLIDNYNGQQDIAKKIIRTIGDPGQRFAEDALRMMRACRFAAQLGFTIEEQTLAAIRENALQLKQVSAERIREELIRTITAIKPSRGIEYFRKGNLLPVFLPELQKCYNVKQNRFHIYDVYYHIMYVIDAFRDADYRVRLAGLFHDIAKPVCKKFLDQKKEPVFYNHDIVSGGIARKVLKRLKFSNNDTALIVHLVKNHMFHYTAEWSDGAVRRFVRNVGRENLPALFKLREADRIGNGSRGPDCSELAEFRQRIRKVIAEDAALKITDLDINGNILMQRFGLKPSRLIGDILKYLLEKVLDNPSLNKREKLAELAEAYIKQSNKI